MNKPRGQSDHYTWVCFCNVTNPSAYEDLIDSIDEEDFEDETDGLRVSGVQLADLSPSVEETLMKKQLLTLLSEEAKHVLDLVLSESKDITSSKYKCISRSSLEQYLRVKERWGNKLIRRVFYELRQYVRGCFQ